MLVNLPQIIPFIPLIASGIGAATAIGSGINATNRNNQVLGQINGEQNQQQQLLQQMLAGINRGDYMNQAKLDGQEMLGQLAADDGARGMLDSGAHSRLAQSNLAKIYADATSRYDQARQGVYQTAFGAHQQLTDTYGRMFNPDPYSGLGPAVQGISSAGASYLDYLKSTPNKVG